MASRTTIQLDGADLLIGQNFIGDRGALIAEQCREVHCWPSLRRGVERGIDQVASQARAELEGVHIYALFVGGGQCSENARNT